MVQVRSLDRDSFTDDGWEVVESCEDGFFEFLPHMSTSSLRWESGDRRRRAYASGGCQLEIEVRCYVRLGVLDNNSLGAVPERCHQGSAIYEVRCTAREFDDGAAGVWAGFEALLNLLGDLVRGFLRHTLSSNRIEQK
jgi:hypothetical protein